MLVQGPDFGQDSHRPPFILSRLPAISLNNNPFNIVNRLVLDQSQSQIPTFNFMELLLADGAFLCIADESRAFNESGKVLESCSGGFEDGEDLMNVDLVLVGLESDQSSGVFFSEAVGVQAVVVVQSVMCARLLLLHLGGCDKRAQTCQDVRMIGKRYK